MYLLIVLFPLIGFLFGILTGRWLSLGVGFVTTFCTFLSFLFSVTVCYINLCSAQTVIVNLTPWLFSDSLFLEWSVCFDSLTCVMLVIVTFISTLVHLYSVEYMENDPHKTRFMSYLSLFTLFMLILVTANNFIQMFVGWEGVGLASYLLINFWFTRLQASKASIKAMLMNRVGDIGLALGIMGIGVAVTYSSLRQAGIV
jgi:NADH:ubiquinone oxidoreductase subunit 5 (subunit L)/multisubunit Na+/H+ antiporter MnhA subunit